MIMPPVISAKKLVKSFGNFEVVKGIDFSIDKGSCVGLLGPNGAGKSTVMKIMAGLDQEFSGEGWMAEGSTVGYLPQEPTLDPS